MSASALAVDFHRAGHAVAAIDLGVGFRHLVADTDPGDLAVCPFMPRGTRALTEADRSVRVRYINQLAARVVVAYAGPLAEAKMVGGWSPQHIAPDRATANRHLADMVGFTADTGSLDELLRSRAEWLIADPDTWARIERVADLLASAGRVTRATVLAAAPPAPARRRRAPVVARPSGG